MKTFDEAFAGSSSASLIELGAQLLKGASMTPDCFATAIKAAFAEGRKTGYGEALEPNPMERTFEPKDEVVP